MLWWGPKNYISPACIIDFRIGGKYLTCMRSPEGKDFWSTGVYREIIPMKQIIYTDSFSDAQGNTVPASYYGMPGDNWPLELTVMVAFENFSDSPAGITSKTKMTLTHIGIPAGRMKEMCKTGWNESFDKLAENLSKLFDE